MKADNAIVLVMQRLHPDDIAGVLLQSGEWVHLNLPAIAEEMQEVAIGPGQIHRRMPGDVLHPEREPRSVLDSLKTAMGPMPFSALYQQRPVPIEGNLIKREWLCFYDEPPSQESLDAIIVSWDTAMSATELANYSVGTVWGVFNEHYYLLDLIRGRFEYPDLRRAVLNAKEQWPGATTLIENKGSGISLIQELRKEGVSVIAITPEMDKCTRLYTTQPRFESRSVFFPKNAVWLNELIAELLAFPNARHDDQVDSISQALAWVRDRWVQTICVGPLPLFQVFYD